MELNIAESWKPVFSEELVKPYFQELLHFVQHEYEENTCYPDKGQIFSAFSYCSPEKIKVVIIGQDPYHGPGQANGLSFSVSEGQKLPPSLVNIFKEIETDLGMSTLRSGNLEAWAKQGVLLLNATLTVRAHKAGSHQGKGWETFTDAIITFLNKNCSNIVFLLWGNYAKKKAKDIATDRHFVLHAGHPSPLSANRGLWFGNQHFSKANAYLQEKNLDQILW
ncbi:MAG: uracil-DNA-glycosylase [Bacteroidota bacterium]|jgi:uracil-DNA glycosylase